MTGWDLAEWAGFERVFGPLLIHERLDVAQALISSWIVKAAGGKNAIPSEFLPRWGANDEQSDEQIMAMFEALISRKEDQPSQ